MAPLAKVTISGQLLNTALISGLNNPYSLAISGTNLFVVSGSTVQKYDTSGAILTIPRLFTLAGSLDLWHDHHRNQYLCGQLSKYFHL